MTRQGQGNPDLDGAPQYAAESRLRALLQVAQLPRSSSYDPDWIVENEMGSNALWWTEYLSQEMALERGIRVLDLGCGKALGSIFLAKEFGVEVWATDCGISATDNLRRIRQAGVGDLVYPIEAEAHALPYADGFFDAVVGINSYQYFGTEDHFLTKHLVRLLRPGGQIGFVVPGLLQELVGAVPEHLRPYWRPEFSTWHSAEWWRVHWEKTGAVDVEVADAFPNGDGWRLWLRWQEAMGRVGLLRDDGGRNISFVRLIARTRPADSRDEGAD